MARREVYSDPDTGRFISKVDAMASENAIRRVFDGGLQSEDILHYGVPESPLDTGGPNYVLDDSSKWGGRLYAQDAPLDLFWLHQEEFPGGYNAFKVTYHMADNPDYPRKYASSEWFSSDQWPPTMDMIDTEGATGIAHILLRKGQ